MSTDGNWYFCYTNDISTMTGPYDTAEEAVEEAKERYSADNDALDEDEMLILKVAARMKLARSVAVELEEIA